MNIWDPYGRWDDIAASGDVNAIKTMITGVGVAWKPNFVAPEVEYVFRSVEDLSGNATVIDFGCGLGRNGRMLKRFFSRVVGYDIPEMIEKHREHHGDDSVYDELYSDISTLTANEKPNLVYDSVVFQHIIDLPYVRTIVEPLLATPSLSAFVSVKNHHIHRTNLMQILSESRWNLLHLGTERLSFDGAPHDVLIMVKPHPEMGSHDFVAI